jgi:hypothetical protein
MRGDLTIRKTRTASGAIAIQVVRHEGRRCIIVKHIGSAHGETECQALLAEAERFAQAHRIQPDLFAQVPPPRIVLDLAHTTLVGVTHLFAREVLLACARRCGLGTLPELYLDLALMRIIEPTSKLRTVQLLEQHFNVRYAERSVYRLLPKLLDHQEAIEKAAILTARDDLGESFSLVLYDVTTLYFESFKEYDFQRPGFSKDNKPQQPQIVIGLITSRAGFPVMHEVFEGNTFEGHTMLEILERFRQRVGETKPVIVADAAMLSKANMQKLDAGGYRYIVGARLANTASQFIERIHSELPRTDRAVKRFDYTWGEKDVAIICEFSSARYRKDKREFDKQITRARALLERNEAGRRAKFVKKSDQQGKPFVFDEALQAKAEKLLGIKGFVTNIPERDLSNSEVVAFYKDLWHVEQAFRMSKSDLRARPIFHYTQEAIKAHVLVCFMALMMGKYLEIKTGQSLRKIRDDLWKVHEAHVRDQRTGQVHVLRMDADAWNNSALGELLKSEFTHY